LIQFFLNKPPVICAACELLMPAYAFEIRWSKGDLVALCDRERPVRWRVIPLTNCSRMWQSAGGSGLGTSTTSAAIWILALATFALLIAAGFYSLAL
jgi:hypothetical protein